MSIREDSYGSVAGVMALTRHLLDGAPMFNDHTRPTLGEVENFIDRWSAVLNTALLAAGVGLPVAHEVARLTADQFVIRQAAAEVELTHRGAGWGDGENDRPRALMMSDAKQTAAQIAAALQAIGDTSVPGRASDGLSYTGLTPRAARLRANTIEQPFFWRGQFDPRN